jgi:hypothetical protein
VIFLLCLFSIQFVSAQTEDQDVKHEAHHPQTPIELLRSGWNVKGTNPITMNSERQNSAAFIYFQTTKGWIIYEDKIQILDSNGKQEEFAYKFTSDKGIGTMYVTFHSGIVEFEITQISNNQMELRSTDLNTQFSLVK